LNPTNPVNRADTWEKQLVESFRNGTVRDEITGVIDDHDGNPRLYFARPIQIKQGECLTCHSTPAAAPASMIKVYGQDGGFGWKFNEIVSAQIVTVPMSMPLEKARSTFVTFMVLLSAFFLVLFLALNITLSRLVLQPITDANVQLEKLASRDSLTGTANRRKLFECLAQNVALAGRPARGFSVIMFDLDSFKRINDTYGHQRGDAVLRETAERVQSVIRGNDFLARIGGEEFVIILSETGLDGAVALAEKVRERIADRPFEGVGQVTTSFGVAEWRLGEDENSLLKRADVALYQAKESGRNKVVAAAREA
jgi:diguanylate cyclase (GGDEF)-like protein